MGSGTTAIACLQHKRNYIGSELSNEYVELSKQRLKPYEMQTSLF
jgi:site-specific DNA-methyltransferase (adenine-specific)